MKQQKVILTLLIGLITSFYVVVQPTSAYSVNEISKAVAEGKASGESIVTNADVLPTQASHIKVGFQSYLIEVVEECEEATVKITKDVRATLTKALRLIIQGIISPNAP